jgi:hypothetical protein
MQSSDKEAVSVGQTKGPDEEHTNALISADSAYLRSAMHQPVQWMEWSEAAFDRAEQEDRPILLDIGAVWCHWCHVMDRESYESEATARIINQNFVAVKVDRDERPDVDARYQAAVSAISGQGGWPLTAFLTPAGKPYYGGTYFPPEDSHGRPSFQRVLLTMAEAFESRRAEVDESATSVMNAIEHNEAFSGRAGTRIEESAPALLEKMTRSLLKSADRRNGGFGTQPKFPHSSALDLLLDIASRRDSEAATSALEPESTATVKLSEVEAESVAQSARRVALLTLEKMAQGGIHDHLAGGFHRYSVDELWIVPHFEKMAYDNSELLKNYVHAYRTFGNEEFALVARDIVHWMDEWLSDREQGGFYASQDADISLDDDGDYFTWTRSEAAEVLTTDELAVAAEYYDIGEIGEMHHNPAKNVLHGMHGLDAAARSIGLSVEQARPLLIAAKEKMYAARLQRPAPYVDKTIYVAWNAMCISAYLEAARALNLPEARAFALKSLDRVLAAAWSGRERGLAHVVMYGEAQAEPKADSTAALRNDRQTIAGVLDDYIFLGHAALDAWEATAELRYYESALDLMESALDRFYDATSGGFFDTENPTNGARRLGALTTRRKPLQDSPTPAANPMAAMLLLRLHALNDSAGYAARAHQTMEAFSGIVEHFGLYAATYALALQRIVTLPVQVCVIGDDAAASELEAAALKIYAVNKSVVRLRISQLSTLPPTLAETLPHLPKIDGSFAVLCSGGACQPPLRMAKDLSEALTRCR